MQANKDRASCVNLSASPASSSRATLHNHFQAGLDDFLPAASVLSILRRAPARMPSRSPGPGSARLRSPMSFGWHTAVPIPTSLSSSSVSPLTIVAGQACSNIGVRRGPPPASFARA